MKIQYRHQKFQADAAKAVVDVFAGQPYLTPTYMMDRGSGNYQIRPSDQLEGRANGYNSPGNGTLLPISTPIQMWQST